MCQLLEVYDSYCSLARKVVMATGSSPLC